MYITRPFDDYGTRLLPTKIKSWLRFQTCQILPRKSFSARKQRTTLIICSDVSPWRFFLLPTYGASHINSNLQALSRMQPLSWRQATSIQRVFAASELSRRTGQAYLACTPDCTGTLVRKTVETRHLMMLYMAGKLKMQQTAILSMELRLSLAQSRTIIALLIDLNRRRWSLL